MKQLVAAVLGVMEDCVGIEKSMTIGKGQSSYKGLADKDVKLKVGESMRRHKLIILPTDIVTSPISIERWEEVDPWSKDTPKAMKAKQSVFCEVITKYKLIHESGESVDLAGYGHGTDPQDKAAGKATTYAMKYTLLYSFMVATGHIDDTDSKHSSDIEVKAPKAPAVKSTPAKEKSKISDVRFADAMAALKTDKKEATLAHLRGLDLTPSQVARIKKELK